MLCARPHRCFALPANFAGQHKLVLTLALAFFSLPSAARAQQVHVYGPQGNGTERRALVVVEAPDGQCASWDELSLEVIGDDAAVSVDDRSAGCARWLHLHSERRIETVTVRAQAGSWSAATAVSLEASPTMEIRARRTSGRARVQVPWAAPDEPLRVVAYWSGGSTQLQQDGQSTFVGDVPRGKTLGFVARSGSLVAAAAVQGSSQSRTLQALILPSDLAVSAEAPTTAAFMIVTDQNGQLSRHVPLQVTSERGRLYALRWLAPGLAAISLEADAQLQSIDLSVRSGEQLLAEAELPVTAGWPLSATVTAPERAAVGEPFPVAAEVMTAGGERMDLRALRIRCNGELSELDRSGQGYCTGTTTGQTMAVVVIEVDGRFVPLAHRAVEIVPPRPSPIVPPFLVPTPQRQHPVALGLALFGGVDTWGRGQVGGSLSVTVTLSSWIGITSWVEYQLTPIEGQPSAEATSLSALTGIRHSLGLYIGGQASIAFDRVFLVIRAGLGPGYALTNVTLGQVETSSADWQLLGALSLGPQIQIGPFCLGLRAGARGVLVSTQSSWDGAPVGFIFQAQGAYVFQ